MDQELVTELKYLISQSKADKQNYSIDQKAKDADLSWEASRFFAALIHKSKPLGFYKSLGEYVCFKEAYQISNNIQVNDSKLFEQFWLRNIIGFVVVSRAISSLCFRFKEISNYRNEILFWLDFQELHKNDEKRRTAKSDIDDAVENYERKNQVTLDKEGIYYKNWASVKENYVEYSDISIYFKQYIDHWDNFAFLSAYEEFRTEDEEKYLIIEEKQLDEIHRSFSQLFPEIPSLEKLNEQNVITKYDTNYQISFYNTEPDYWGTLKDKIGGFLWELLVNDNQFTDDKHRLKHWMTKVLYWPMWPDPIEYIKKRSATRFINAAFELVLADTDIIGVESEFAKVCIDGRFSHNTLLTFESMIRSKEFKLNSADSYELLASFNKWEKRAHTTYLYSQDSREMLAFLVKVIVNYDDEYSGIKSEESGQESIPHFFRVISLLRESSQKPFLMWEVTRFILKDRPDIIPYLIASKGMETIAFILLDDLSFLPEQKQMLNLEVWQKATQLLLKNLTRTELREGAVKIFQVYRSLNEGKYEIPYNRSNKKSELEIQEFQREKEAAVLYLIEDSRFHQYMTNQKQSSFLLPVLYHELANVVINYSTKPLYQNGTVQFPIMQWDAICWLLKVSTYWKYHDQKDEMRESAEKLTLEFLNRYLESIEITSIQKYNYWEERDETGIPNWSEKIERLHFIEWIYPVYFLNAKGILNRLLSPRIDIETTTDRYHDKNRFSADKLRTHIGVLLQVLRKLLLPAMPYGFEKKELKTIKRKIESQIIDYIKIHIKDDPAQGKIDLFDFNKEWRFQTTDKEALFPQIARAINWFSDKDTIIYTISQIGDISKLLTLLDLVKSEGVKQKLVKKIQSLNIQEFLETYSWIPEVEHAVTNLSKHPELLPQIDQAIEFWRQKVLSRRENTEYKMVLYKAELLAAYFRNSEALIDGVIEPEYNYHDQKEIRTYDYKLFYKGLLYIQIDPARSHKIFDTLVKHYHHYPSFALNRMVAKINLAKAADETKLYREALEEWNDTRKDFTNETLELLEPELSENILSILSITGEYGQLDDRYKILDLPNRMEPIVIGIVVKSLLDQKRTIDALQLLSSAETYHQFGDVKDIQFVKDLETQISQVDNIDELRNHYYRIFNCEPGKLIRIFPENLNGKQDLHEFIVKEITLAVDKLLEKIKSIEDITSEDKYNDLVELLLDARINPWGWHVEAQSRGAYSASGGPQPGERDLPITNRLKSVMMVCEAFINRNVSHAQAHIRKVFDYHHQRNAFVMLAYDLSPTIQEFEEKWKKYCDTVVPHATYPLGFEMKNPIKEVNKEFGFDKSAIKLCLSEHGNGTFLYHIFVHIKYKTISP